MERLRNVTSQGQISKFREDQVAHASNWDGIPDSRASVLAAATQIRVLPSNSSTTTYVNALQPTAGGWQDPPGGYGEMNRRG